MKYCARDDTPWGSCHVRVSSSNIICKREWAHRVHVPCALGKVIPHMLSKSDDFPVLCTPRAIIIGISMSDVTLRGSSSVRIVNCWEQYALSHHSPGAIQTVEEIKNATSSICVGPRRCNIGHYDIAGALFAGTLFTGLEHCRC